MTTSREPLGDATAAAQPAKITRYAARENDGGFVKSSASCRLLTAEDETDRLLFPPLGPSLQSVRVLDADGNVCRVVFGAMNLGTRRVTLFRSAAYEPADLLHHGASYRDSMRDGLVVCWA